MFEQACYTAIIMFHFRKGLFPNGLASSILKAIFDHSGTHSRLFILYLGDIFENSAT